MYIGLEAHLNKEAEQEDHQERIESYARDLMRPEGECYPFAPDRLREALNELTDGQMKVLAVCLERALELKSSDAHANHLALVALASPAKEYWYKDAMAVASKRIKE